MKAELGGDKLLPGFVEAGSADGKFYAAPYYSGARAVFYNKDAFAAAGVEVPTTLAEFTTAAEKLQAANPAGSGFWLPGQDWYNGASWLYTNGGDFAVKDGDKWKGALEDPKSLKGLEQVQELFKNATKAPADANSDQPWVPFNAGQAAMFSAPTWARWSIDLPAVQQGRRQGRHLRRREGAPRRSSRPATRSTPVSSRCRASRPVPTPRASPVARTSPSRPSRSTRSWPRTS